jgi:hypothetical protein
MVVRDVSKHVNNVDVLQAVLLTADVLFNDSSEESEDEFVLVKFGMKFTNTKQPFSSIIGMPSAPRTCTNLQPSLNNTSIRFCVR